MPPSCVLPGGWEASFGVEVGSSAIKGRRIMFRGTLIEDVQKHFDESQWVGGVQVESWVEAPFCPQKRKQGHVVEVEDGSLLGFAAFKDLQVVGEEVAEEEAPLNIQDLWVVPKRATRDADIRDVYGVGLEDEDEDSDNEDLNQAGEIASSSSDVHNPPSLSSTSANPAAQLVFKYHVDEAVLKATERGRMHEWTNIPLQLHEAWVQRERGKG